MELLQMAIPVIRGDFTILETYKLKERLDIRVDARDGTDSSGCIDSRDSSPLTDIANAETNFEKISLSPNCSSSTVRVRCPMTAFGGNVDALCSMDKLMNWRSFSSDCDTHSDDDSESRSCIIFKPDIEPRQKMFNAFVDVSGGHFTFLDKVTGGEAWFRNILINVCLHGNRL